MKKLFFQLERFDELYQETNCGSDHVQKFLCGVVLLLGFLYCLSYSTSSSVKRVSLYLFLCTVIVIGNLTLISVLHLCIQDIDPQLEKLPLAN